MKFFLILIFPFWAIKLGRFMANSFFQYLSNTQSYQRKSENEEKRDWQD